MTKLLVWVLMLIVIRTAVHFHAKAHIVRFRLEPHHQYFMHVCWPRVKFVVLNNCDHYVYTESEPPY